MKYKHNIKLWHRKREIFKFNTNFKIKIKQIKVLFLSVDVEIKGNDLLLDVCHEN